jgi:hypothetical protein
LSREYLASFRFPPLPNEPACKRGEACVLRHLDAHVDFVCRAFRLPDDPAGARLTAADRDLCIDCLQAHWELTASEYAKCHHVPAMPLNCFTVDDGAYPTRLLLGARSGDMVHGIAGLVPKFVAAMRAMRPIKAGDAQSRGYPPNATHFCCVEVDGDF